MRRPTQPGFQIFDIASLWSALSPYFIICTIMSESGARRALGLVPITFELSFPAYHACNTLWLGCSGLLPGSIGTILVGRTDGVLRF